MFRSGDQASTSAASAALTLLIVAAFPALAAQVAPPDATATSVLAAQLSQDVPESEAAFEALAQLERALETGDRQTAAYQADSALARLPPVSDWRPLVLAELLAPTGDTAEVRLALEPLDRRGEYWLRWGWKTLVATYEEAGDLAGARTVALARAANEGDPEGSAGAWARAGKLALELGDPDGARADLWRGLALGAASEGAREAAVMIDEARWPVEAADEILLGRALLAAGSLGRAVDRLAPYVFGEKAPTPLGPDELRIELGRSLFELRRFSEAERMLSPLSGPQAPSGLRAEALYWIGRSALGRGATAEAEVVLEELAQLAPGTSLAERGVAELLAREISTGFGPRARQHLERLLEVGVGTSEVGTTVVQLASTEYLSGDYTSAVEIFEDYFRGSLNDSRRQQAGYWAALSHERVGDEAVARARLTDVYEADPFTFYGVLAGVRIGAPVVPSEIPRGPRRTAGLVGELDNALIRLRVHRLVPVAGSLAYELDRLTAYFAQAGTIYEFAEALVHGGFPLQAIVLGRRMRRDEGSWNLRLLRIVHPLPYGPAVVREARERGLDPFFVAGLIRQESAFDARIRSSAGAVGLMQLMPPTAREVSENLGLTYTPEMLTDPDTNLRLGTSYVASMVRRFDGRVEDVLAAYNAGPGRMRQWQSRPTYADRDVFLEHIPFDETRNYVKVVQQYATIYAALYGCADFQPCPGLTYASVIEQSPLAGGEPRTLLVGSR